MRSIFLKLYVKGTILAEAIKEEHGQDLVEYAAVISVVVLGLIAGMGTLADGINTAMVSVSTKITNKLS
jgi:Flp pilus assembly pilin Flp